MHLSKLATLGLLMILATAFQDDGSDKLESLQLCLQQQQKTILKSLLLTFHLISSLLTGNYFVSSCPIFLRCLSLMLNLGCSLCHIRKWYNYCELLCGEFMWQTTNTNHPDNFLVDLVSSQRKPQSKCTLIHEA